MANWPNITHQSENDSTDEVVIRHQGINYLQKRDVLAASISNARWISDGNYKAGSEIQGSDGLWYVAVVDTGSATGNSTNPVTKTDDTVWKMSLRIGDVNPLNNNWNGYLDPDHTTPIEKEDTSSGTRAFAADTEIAPNLFVSGTGDVTFSSTGISWLAGNSLYRVYSYTPEQLVNIDVNTISVYLKGQDGSEYFTNNSTAGVNITKPDSTTLKVEITNSVFTTLGITKLWRWFDTERLGRVPELSVDSFLDSIQESLRLERTIQDLTPSRSAGITYTNNTGTEKFVSVRMSSNVANASLIATVNGSDYTTGTVDIGITNDISFHVPRGGSYSVTVNTGTPTLSIWTEETL